MRPRFTETEPSRGFLSGKFCAGFDDRAEWIAHHAGILPVRVVDAPQLIAGLQSRGRAHSGS